MALVPFDDRDGADLVRRRPGPLARRQAAPSLAWPALCQRRFRGRALLCRQHLQAARAYRAPDQLRAASSPSTSPIPPTRSTPPASRWCAPTASTDAYVRPIAWRGSEQLSVSAQRHQDPFRHRLLGLAEPVRRRPHEGRAARPRALEAPAPRHRADRLQGRRPLHDRHARQARGRGEGLRRRLHARLARPDRGGDRRQRLLRHRRRDPHADARLLPRRHHPPHRHVDRARPPDQGGRARDAGRAISAGRARCSSPAPPPR